MKRGEFDDSDLINAKNSILRSLNSVENSLGSIGGYLLGQILSNDSATVEESIELVSKVTREEVIALAQTVTPELEYILGGGAE